MRPVLLGISALVLAQAVMAHDTEAQEGALVAVSSFTESTTYSRPFERFIERVNEDGKGILRINYVGGPKAMPPFEVGNALKGGVVDIANVTGAFYTNAMPEADAWKLTERPMAELRQNGGYAPMAALYAPQLHALLFPPLRQKADLEPGPHRPQASDHAGVPRFLPGARRHRRPDRTGRGLHGTRARRRRRLRLADHRRVRPRLERENEVPGRSRLLHRGSVGPRQQEHVGSAGRGAEKRAAQSRRARRGRGCRGIRGGEREGNQASGHNGHSNHQVRSGDGRHLCREGLP